MGHGKGDPRVIPRTRPERIKTRTTTTKGRPKVPATTVFYFCTASSTLLWGGCETIAQRVPQRGGGTRGTVTRAVTTAGDCCVLLWQPWPRNPVIRAAIAPLARPGVQGLPGDFVSRSGLVGVVVAERGGQRGEWEGGKRRSRDAEKRREVERSAENVCGLEAVQRGAARCRR